MWNVAQYSTLRLHWINTDAICKMQYPIFKSSSTPPNMKNVLNSPGGGEEIKHAIPRMIFKIRAISESNIINYIDCESREKNHSETDQHVSLL